MLPHPQPDVSLLQTPSIPITLQNLGKYMSELARAMPPPPPVQVGQRKRKRMGLKASVRMSFSGSPATVTPPSMPYSTPQSPAVARCVVQVEFEDVTFTTRVPVRPNDVPNVGTALLGMANPPTTRTHAVLQVLVFAEIAHCPQCLHLMMLC